MASLFRSFYLEWNIQSEHILFWGSPPFLVAAVVEFCLIVMAFSSENLKFVEQS